MSILVSALCATIQGSENRISHLLFKQTVELCMMMNALVTGLEINDSQLDDLHCRYVQNVKKINGSITFKDTLSEYNSGELKWSRQEWLSNPICSCPHRYAPPTIY